MSLAPTHGMSERDDPQVTVGEWEARLYAVFREMIRDRRVPFSDHEAAIWACWEAARQAESEKAVLSPEAQIYVFPPRAT